MALRFAFVGFQHAHVQQLYQHTKASAEVEVVGACEEDPSARKAAEKWVEISHASFDEMLDRVPCDVVAIGDYFGRRGELAVRALKAGKHVMADKPICTRLAELDEIERIAGEKGLKVGCMLTMRDSPRMIGLRNLVREGTIGEVHAISFGGQHRLNLGTRQGWYFEPGKHGGTINDIGVHAVDILPWITGLEFTTVNAARCWNAFVPQFPHFEDGAQMMLTMNNGCGVLGDVSYFMQSGNILPHNWRMTFWGRRGLLETSETMKEIHVARGGSSELEPRPLPEGCPGGYMRSFLNDVRGESRPDDLVTRDVLRISRTALTIQAAADEKRGRVELSRP